MRKELQDMELEQVAGGRYYINVNKKLLTFTTIKKVFTLNCSPYAAMEAMDTLVGQFATVDEYDAACLQLLRDKGWIAD